MVDIHRVGMKIYQIQSNVQEAIGIFNDIGTAGSINEEEAKFFRYQL